MRIEDIDGRLNYERAHAGYIHPPSSIMLSSQRPRSPTAPFPPPQAQSHAPVHPTLAPGPSTSKRKHQSPRKRLRGNWRPYPCTARIGSCRPRTQLSLLQHDIPAPTPGETRDRSRRSNPTGDRPSHELESWNKAVRSRAQCL